MRRRHIRFTAMACENDIEVYADTAEATDAACAAAVAEVKRIEAKYSRYRDDSVITTINHAAGHQPVLVDAETASLLDYADTCYRLSDGLFDVTSGVLRRAWDFRAGVPPAQAKIDALLPLIGWQHVQRQSLANGRQQVYLPKACMEIDFGGLGKEYAADRVAAVLLAYGIGHAYVNLGGDVVVIGPHPDGSPWQVGIRHPRDDGKVLTTLQLHSGALATSGDYERYFDYQGRRYSHLLNPRNGQPVQGLQSVTVLAPSCLTAGSLTTIAMLKGHEGRVWLAASGASYWGMDDESSFFSHVNTL